MSMGRRKTLLLATFLIASLSHFKVFAQSSCTTQRNEPGICVPILTCRSIIDLLKSAPRPLPPSVSFLVKRSHCGTIASKIHVCCEPNDVSAEETTTTQQTVNSPSTNIDDRASKSKTRKSVETTEAQVQSGMAILQTTKCGKSDPDRISNGEDTNLSEFPWMALLVYFDGVERTLDCGGSLITDSYVLTAAHCILVLGGRKQLVSVRLGEHDKNQEIDCVGVDEKRKCAPPHQEIDVEEAIYHKDYSPYKFVNDIGLVRLVSRAIINKSVKPICLPITQRSNAVILNRMIIAGWGKVETGTPANILQKATIPVRENNYCQETLKAIRVTENHLCAGGGDKNIDTCLGDSGGPMFFLAPYRKGARYVQYGVVSSGASDCGTNFPSLFSRVTSYVPWIAGNLTP